MAMIDAHVHMGSIPSGEEKWGNFRDYHKIAKKNDVTKYCVVPIGLPENFVDGTTPDNNSILEEIGKNKSVIPIYWF